jgi:ADP-ribose pyrophosphatase YjhB (NUDIX family)
LAELLTDLPLARRWQEQLHPMPSVIAIVSRATNDGASYLLIKRRKEPYIGKWALVGGKWDFGESLAAAVIREVKEETGLTTLFSGLRGVVNYRLMPRAEADRGAHFSLFLCEVHASEGEACEQREGTVAWFSTIELGELNTAGQIVPTDFLILDRYRRPTRLISYFEAEVVAAREGADSIEVVRFEALP